MGHARGEGSNVLTGHDVFTDCDRGDYWLVGRPKRTMQHHNYAAPSQSAGIDDKAVARRMHRLTFVTSQVYASMTW